MMTLTFDIIYRCNYVATIEGLIGNKMIVDTVFEAPDWFPFWIKCVLFFLITIPVNLFTLADDLLTALILYNRFMIHSDYFDIGIIFGKGSRIVF